MIESLLIFFWALLISMFSIPTIISVAHSKRILDVPDFRKMHGAHTPRLGGLGIFAGFMTGVAIFGQMSIGIQQLLAGSLVIFFVGVKDDINGVSVFKKFLVQVLAAGIVLFYADIRISSFQGLFGIYDLEVGTSYAFSFLDWKEPILHRLVSVLVEQFGELFPELKEQQGYVEKIILQEEKAFLRTLEAGLKRFAKYKTVNVRDARRAIAKPIIESNEYCY